MTPAEQETSSTAKAGIRYFLASLVALVIDYLATLFLHHGLGLALSVAAGLSLLVVGLIFYFVHEFWTFQRSASALRLVLLDRRHHQRKVIHSAEAPAEEG